MKLKLLLLLQGIFVCLQLSAYEVSTEVQKKNILLEEFTGIHCVYCPEGHKIANNLIAAQEGTVYTIAIHSGSFATPSQGEPDFRISEGAAIDSYFKVSGYPAGMINRKPVTLNGQLLSTVLNRSSWSKAAKEVNKEDAPVNLWMNVAFDGASRKLTVDMEAYYTADSDLPENFMNIVITQSNILGPQSGGAVGDNYIHRHQLKAFVTPLWGDPIPNPRTGEYFTKKYVYDLPESVNNIPVKAEDLEVLAFVTANRTDVLNVIGQKPSYMNYTKPLKITLSDPKEGYAPRYAFNFFDVTVKNESHRLLTAIDFNVTINNETQPVAWTGNISAYQSELVRLFVEPYEIQENNTFEIQTVKANDASVNALLSGTFEQPAKTTPRIIAEIKPDNYADENTYTIKDRNGETVYTFGPYPAGSNRLQKDTVELDANQIYCFEVTDSWSDGINGGSIALKKSDGTAVEQISNISSFGDRLFFATSLPYTGVYSPQPASAEVFVDERNNICLHGNFTGQVRLDLYAITGQRIWNRVLLPEQNSNDILIPTGNPASGFYLLKINGNDREETVKIFIR
ncbi:MAG: Omp28-related outer membrane protein [Tannerella sp.]|nr:Omp28-related outer membrane protein [Tannerella sp.]